MRQEITPANQALTVSSAAPSASSFTVKGFVHKTVQITGTWVGNVTIEATLDGSNWSEVAGPFTAPCIVQLEELSCLGLRIAGGAGWGSGTASATHSGFNSGTF